MMTDLTLGAVEARFADIIWANEPLSSSQLTKQAEAVLGWKKSTTFTVLKRLCNKGLFQNNNGTVSSKISKTEFEARQSEQFVEDTFHGSLPAFLAAFVTRKPLSAEELAEIRRMIDTYEEG